MQNVVVQIDRERWSGEGDLTTALLAKIASIEQVGFVRVEDAESGGGGAGFSFICNEIYVAFRIRRTIAWRPVLGIARVPAIALKKSLDLSGLGELLAPTEGIGAPDYAGTDMLQYLRTERVAAPYQARAPKLVELVRIYEVEYHRPNDR